MEIYTHIQKSTENKKITFFENVKKIYQLKVADPFNRFLWLKFLDEVCFYEFYSILLFEANFFYSFCK